MSWELAGKPCLPDSEHKSPVLLRALGTGGHQNCVNLNVGARACVCRKRAHANLHMMQMTMAASPREAHLL